MVETEPETARVRLHLDCGHASVQPAAIVQAAGTLVGALTTCPACLRLVRIRAVEVMRR